MQKLHTDTPAIGVLVIIYKITDVTSTLPEIQRDTGKLHSDFQALAIIIERSRIASCVLQLDPLKTNPI